MKQPFSDNMLHMADSMGISLYQRFSKQEASLFLRISIDELSKLIRQHKISFIQVTAQQIDFFGFQLLEYLLNNLVLKETQHNDTGSPDRILRSREVQELTGLSRTTIWRMERNGKFPQRVNLSTNSVGWFYNQIMDWMKTR